LEIDAKKQLFDRLDECLTWEANRLGQKFSRTTVEEIYQLRDLIDQHEFLKVAHDFTPDEVDALLCFHDPLAVADACWQKYGDGREFKICDALDGINAYERFPLTQAEQERRDQPLVQRLKDVLDENYAAYSAALMGKSKQELVEQSESIATTRTAYAYMKDDFQYEYGEAGLLLQLDDPLSYLASHWPIGFDDTGNDDDVIQEVIAELKDPEYLQTIQQTSAAAQMDKPSLRGQLSAAVQEVNQRPSQDGRSQQRPDAPNR